MFGMKEKIVERAKNDFLWKSKYTFRHTFFKGPSGLYSAQLDLYIEQQNVVAYYFGRKTANPMELAARLRD